VVSAYECFEACFDAWTFFMGGQPARLITIGQGSPDRLHIVQPAASA
jgi:hypothetical protein